MRGIGPRAMGSSQVSAWHSHAGSSVHIPSRFGSSPLIIGNVATFNATNATSHSITLPSAIAPNDLLLMFGVCDTGGSGRTLTAPSGWSNVSTPGASTLAQMACWGRVADGSEGGASVSWTVSSAEKTATAMVALRGTGGLSTLQATSATFADGASYNPSSFSPSGGTRPLTWVMGVGWREGGVYLSPPTNYPGRSDGVNHARTSQSDGAGVYLGTRSTIASSEDPGSMSWSSWNASGVYILVAVPSD